ncbi:ester cyclase [Xanthovirga aplysinae]|uniref:ester cyclase n=1 Tax=Xanthovirga aplysinae TaxID=2529853 RepID=UPI0012BCD01D|nr:ester cyclase [Xanthovirga aplysinae]MTI32181.1 hypothetical protein [Xanthovirga aplysinae]
MEVLENLLNLEDKNKALVKDFYKAFNARDYDEIAKYYISDYNYNGTVQVEGPEGGVAMVKKFVGAFDMKITILDLLAEKDKVMVFAQGDGQHLGEFNGIQPSRKKISIRAMIIYRIERNQIAEMWEIAEELNLLKQPGVVASK